MTDIAIRVENLSKRYRIGQYVGSGAQYKTLRESLTNAVSAPLRRLRQTGDGRRKTGPPSPASRPRSSVAGQPSTDGFIWALKEVSFEVKRGEVLGIIGSNGAGKSTLLKILTRITEPTEGRAELNGHVGSLLEVGTGFHPELTGRENIYLSGNILGMSKKEIDRKFDEIVDFSGIEKFIDTPVKRYSSGMRVRLGFAVAAHLEPEILLIDEVLAVGDAAFQKKCLGKMGDVARGGRTVLFVSHNMNAIEQLCTVGMLLNEGHLKYFDRDVRQIITNYLFDYGNDFGASEWINSGKEFDNVWFKPLRFFVSDEDGRKQSMPLRNDAQAWVHIEAEIRVVDPALTVGYAVYTDTGQLLYWSYQTDAAEDKWPILHEGICTLRGRLPRRLLNEGAYKVELIGGLHHREWLFKSGTNCPSIQVHIQGGLSDSPYWMVKRPGILAPVVEWVIVH